MEDVFKRNFDRTDHIKHIYHKLEAQGFEVMWIEWRAGEPYVTAYYRR